MGCCTRGKLEARYFRRADGRDRAGGIDGKEGGKKDGKERKAAMRSRAGLETNWASDEQKVTKQGSVRMMIVHWRIQNWKEKG